MSKVDGKSYVLASNLKRSDPPTLIIFSARPYALCEVP